MSIIQPLLPNKPRGKPRHDRKVLNGIYCGFTALPGRHPERYGRRPPAPTASALAKIASGSHLRAVSAAYDATCDDHSSSVRAQLRRRSAATPATARTTLGPCWRSRAADDRSRPRPRRPALALTLSGPPCGRAPLRCWRPRPGHPPRRRAYDSTRSATPSPAEPGHIAARPPRRQPAFSPFLYRYRPRRALLQQAQALQSCRHPLRKTRLKLPPLSSQGSYKLPRQRSRMRRRGLSRRSRRPRS